ncbi:MAG: class B sortase [Clostridia bacterium]|nr:class B sortase [Clostridia bacterium]
MAKYDLNNMTAEEHFLSGQKQSSPKEAENQRRSADFESSLKEFSSDNVVKKRRKKKRKLGLNGMIRLVCLCVCIGVLVFSVSKIVNRVNDLSAAKDYYANLLNADTGSELPAIKPARPVTPAKDLLTFLGSDNGGIEMVDTDTRNYYDYLRDRYYEVKSYNPDCIGFISVSDTTIEYPIMKTTNNDYYLHYTPEREKSSMGAIFADYRLNNDYDRNMNTILYGHCMTNGTMFRPIKYFFDSEYRYTQAQEMKITVVTEKAIYVYEYFSGYRSEGGYFINTFTDKSSKDNYYNFLKNLRAKNSIPKTVGYNANSKIITLVTCTNLGSKPDERYVLHGILDEYFLFEN